MYTKESVRLAERIQRDKVYRDELVRRLRIFDELITYSTQHFDRLQSLAAYLNVGEEGQQS